MSILEKESPYICNSLPISYFQGFKKLFSLPLESESAGELFNGKEEVGGKVDIVP